MPVQYRAGIIALVIMFGLLVAKLSWDLGEISSKVIGAILALGMVLFLVLLPVFLFVVPSRSAGDAVGFTAFLTVLVVGFGFGIWLKAKWYSRN